MLSPKLKAIAGLLSRAWRKFRKVVSFIGKVLLLLGQLFLIFIVIVKQILKNYYSKYVLKEERLSKREQRRRMYSKKDDFDK